MFYVFWDLSPSTRNKFYFIFIKFIINFYTLLKVAGSIPASNFFLFTLHFGFQKKTCPENSDEFLPRSFIYNILLSVPCLQQEQTSQTLCLCSGLLPCQNYNVKFTISPLSPHYSLEKIIFHEVRKLLMKLLMMFFTMMVPLYECGWP